MAEMDVVCFEANSVVNISVSWHTTPCSLPLPCSGQSQSL